MKKLFVVFTLLASFVACAPRASAQGTASRIRQAGTFPATCNAGGANVPADVIVVSGVMYQCSSTNSWTAAGGPAGVPPDATVCPSNVYTIPSTDRWLLVKVTDASACTVTLPDPTTAGFTNNFHFALLNVGAGASTVGHGAGSATFAYNGTTAATVVIPTGYIAYFFSDNANWTVVYMPAYSGANVIGKNVQALATTVITTGTCATAVTVTATGADPTTPNFDTLTANFASDPSGVTGLAPSASGGLYVDSWLTANTVHLRECNNTGGSITPGAMSIVWKVIR